MSRAFYFGKPAPSIAPWEGERPSKVEKKFRQIIDDVLEIYKEEDRDITDEEIDRIVRTRYQELYPSDDFIGINKKDDPTKSMKENEMKHERAKGAKWLKKELFE